MKTSITIPAAFEGTATARNMVARAMSGSTDSAERIEDARLLTSEVVTNALRHAGLGAEGSIGVAVNVSQRNSKPSAPGPRLPSTSPACPKRTGRFAGWLM